MELGTGIARKWPKPSAISTNRMGWIMKVFALAIGTLALLAPLNVAWAGLPVQSPEPATLSLMAIGVAGALVASRFRKKK
jgi:hypothetical protein